ncbi:MAG: hypothetical protein KAY24_01065 [Candidatus Eisenbacteria sp.]|nr:hypothetical protein [Candidatus Eisenbacteria bacterium]
MTASRIYGIDPGPLRSALVVIDTSRTILVHVYDENARIRGRLDCELTALNTREQHYLAIEDIRAYGRGVRPEALETAVQVGRFVELAECYLGESAVHRVPRSVVLARLIGMAHGKKIEVKTRLIEIYGSQKVKLKERRKWKDPVTGKKRTATTEPGPTAGLREGHDWDALAMCEWFMETGGRV